jgi:hypothetical protein
MSVFLQDTTNPEVKRLFYQKLYTRPRQKAFTTLEIGVESLRRGLNAFYTGSEAYKVMSDTYEESEKCRLKEISIIPTNVLGIPVKKGSPYREHITQKYVLLATQENSSDLDSVVDLGSERHVAAQCIPVKNALGRRAVVSLACE